MFDSFPRRPPGAWPFETTRGGEGCCTRCLALLLRALVWARSARIARSHAHPEGFGCVGEGRAALTGGGPASSSGRRGRSRASEGALTRCSGAQSWAAAVRSFKTQKGMARLGGWVL